MFTNNNNNSHFFCFFDTQSTTQPSKIDEPAPSANDNPIPLQPSDAAYSDNPVIGAYGKSPYNAL